MSKKIKMYIEVEMNDENKLMDFASRIYEQGTDLDLMEEMEDYPDDNYKIVRSLYEVLVGSAERDYTFADAGFKIEGFGDER